MHPTQKINCKEICWRLGAIFSPLIVPQFMNFGENMCMYIPILWMIMFAPIYFTPSLDPEDWEKSALWAITIFNGIGKIYLGGVIFCLVLNLYLGKFYL
jgi:hypothetical protein